MSHVEAGPTRRAGGGLRGRTMWRSLLVVAAMGALLAGGGFAVYAATSVTIGTGVAGCFDPTDYGAVADDGADDHVPIQAAIDAAAGAGGGTVCLPSGRWTLARALPGSYDRLAAPSTHGAHVDITGTGPGTVLELVGDQAVTTTSVPSLDPGARDITIERLTIDTSATTNTDEQTHAISIGSGVCASSNGTCSEPVADVTVRGGRFEPPSAAPGVRKGDRIRRGCARCHTARRRALVYSA
jgi:hypothetical protein